MNRQCCRLRSRATWPNHQCPLKQALAAPPLKQNARAPSRQPTRQNLARPKSGRRPPPCPRVVCGRPAPPRPHRLVVFCSSPRLLGFLFLSPIPVSASVVSFSCLFLTFVFPLSVLLSPFLCLRTTRSPHPPPPLPWKKTNGSPPGQGPLGGPDPPPPPAPKPCWRVQNQAGPGCFFSPAVEGCYRPSGGARSPIRPRDPKARATLPQNGPGPAGPGPFPPLVAGRLPLLWRTLGGPGPPPAEGQQLLLPSISPEVWGSFFGLVVPGTPMGPGNAKPGPLFGRSSGQKLVGIRKGPKEELDSYFPPGRAFRTPRGGRLPHRAPPFPPAGSARWFKHPPVPVAALRGRAGVVPLAGPARFAAPLAPRLFPRAGCRLRPPTRGGPESTESTRPKETKQPLPTLDLTWLTRVPARACMAPTRLGRKPRARQWLGGPAALVRGRTRQLPAFFDRAPPPPAPGPPSCKPRVRRPTSQRA